MPETSEHPPQKLTKKQRAALEKEKHLQGKKKEEEKVRIKEEKKKERKEIPLGNKISGLIICAISLFLLGFIGWFLSGKFFSPANLSDLLPSDSTIAYFEMNLNNNHTSSLRQKLNQYPELNESALKSRLSALFNADFDGKIKPWLGEKIGAAFLKTKNNKSSAVFFISYKNKNAVLDFLANLKINNREILKEENFLKKTIYEFSISQSFKFAFVNRYLILSNEKEPIKKIISSLNNKSLLISGSPKYTTVANNLSINRFAFGYFNLENIFNFIPEQAFLSGWKEKLIFLKPFLSNFLSAGLTLSSNENGLIMQTYTALNKRTDRREEPFSKEKYRGNLLRAIDADYSSFWGGSNLKDQIDEIIQLADKTYPAASFLIESAGKAQISRYFGDQISLDRDIYPLLAGEYLLAFKQGIPSENNIYQFILDLKSIENTKKIENLKEKFIRQNNLLPIGITNSPEEKTAVLAEEIKENLIEYENQKISEISLPSPYSKKIFFSVINKNALISNDLAQIKRTVDLILKNDDGIKKNAKYQSVLSDILYSSDEIIFIQSALLKNIFPAWNENFIPVNSIISGQNIFDDGISTRHYFIFK